MLTYVEVHPLAPCCGFRMTAVLDGHRREFDCSGGPLALCGGNVVRGGEGGGGISLTRQQGLLKLWLLSFIGHLTSQQHAIVSQARICSDSRACCHTLVEVAGQTFLLTQSQYIDTGPTNHGADPITPDAKQGSK